jgi:hypothetical protein
MVLHPQPPASVMACARAWAVAVPALQPQVRASATALAAAVDEAPVTAAGGQSRAGGITAAQTYQHVHTTHTAYADCLGTMSIQSGQLSAGKLGNGACQGACKSDIHRVGMTAITQNREAPRSVQKCGC